MRTFVLNVLLLGALVVLSACGGDGGGDSCTTNPFGPGCGGGGGGSLPPGNAVELLGSFPAVGASVVPGQNIRFQFRYQTTRNKPTSLKVIFLDPQGNEVPSSSPSQPLPSDHGETGITATIATYTGFTGQTTKIRVSMRDSDSPGTDKDPSWDIDAIFVWRAS